MNESRLQNGITAAVTSIFAPRTEMPLRSKLTASAEAHKSLAKKVEKDGLTVSIPETIMPRFRVEVIFII